MSLFNNNVKIFGKAYISELLSENYDIEILDQDLKDFGYYTTDTQERKAESYWKSDKFYKVYVLRGEHGNIWYNVLESEPESNWDTGIESIYLVKKNSNIDFEDFVNYLDVIYRNYECYSNGDFSRLFTDYLAYENHLLECYNEQNETKYDTIQDLIDAESQSEWNHFIEMWSESEAIFWECNGFDMDVLESAIRE